ncbi:MAG: PIG-L family deacetylase [Kiritimatiellae bacterium]|nr:PIG-L family deacetylase [Kiritimatiellia bacterium]
MKSNRIRSVLVLAGHSDDSVIAVGGLLRRFVKAGVRVHVFCFGNGDEAFADMPAKDSAVAKDRAEAAAAHKALGVASFECFGLPDFGVQRNRETYRACIGAIRKYKPDIILGHDWREYFQHRDMARLACDAWWQAGWNCSADLGRPWQAQSLFHFEVLHDIQDPTHLVDVTDTFPDKIRAWKKFASAQDHLSSMVTQMEARARLHGSKIGVKYAEALRQSFFIPTAVRRIEELP